MITLLLQHFAFCPFFVAATASSPSKTSPCTSSWPSTSERCPYYHRARTHLALDKDAPDVRPVELPEAGRIVEIPEVGGSHHRYVRQAA